MKKIFFAIAIIFGLNFVWEIAQSVLYAPHYQGLGQLVRVHLWASVGDVVMVIIILLSNEIIFRRFLKNKNKKTQVFFIIFLGFLLATVVEKYALANGLWAYNHRMPIVSGLNVGLTPVLQMMLIPAVGFIFLGNNTNTESI